MGLFSEKHGAIGILLLLSFLFVCSVNSEEILKNDQKRDNKESSRVINKEKGGKRIHLRILNKYKKVDIFYKNPTIWRAMKEPLSIISIPIREWEILSEKERDYLSMYAASTVKIVKNNPFKYCSIPQNAPFAPIIRKNVGNMNENSWGIMAGRISADGRDILSDKLVRSGY